MSGTGTGEPGRAAVAVILVVGAAGAVLAAAAAVAAFSGGQQPPDALRPAGTGVSTVLFDLTYTGIESERATADELLERCMRQPGTDVTGPRGGSPGTQHVSVTGDRAAVRAFEQCLRQVVATRVQRVPQQRSSTPTVDIARTLTQRYDQAPAWPGDPWTKDGQEVPPEELALAAGPEHCGWQEVVYLGGTALRAPRDERGPHWVRDPQGVLDFEPRAQAEFQARAAPPQDAAWTGYVQDGVELWTAPSDKAAYVYLVNAADRADVERWVRAGALCA